MSTLRRKFITVLTVLLCAMLCLGTVFLIPNKSATAARGDNWEIIGTKENELYLGKAHGSDGDKYFNGDLLDELYKEIIGTNTTYSATYEGVAQYVNSKGSAGLTSADIRSNHTDSHNISVWFGGFKWDVVYMTTVRTDVSQKTDANIKGDIVLDLWLSSDEVDENKLVKFSTRSTTGNVTNAIKYPDSMYATSYIRVHSLSAQGQYSDTTTSLTTDSAPDDTYAHFAMQSPNNGKNSLIEYIVQPKDIEYQENLSSQGAYAGTYYQFPNDAYSTTMTGWYKENNVASIQTKDGYADWKDDYVWLPAYAETGNADGYGLWQINTAIRSSADQSVWLRTGQYNTGGNARSQTSSGDNKSTPASTPLAVRPAIHLNLTKAEQNSIRFLDAPKDVSNDYNGQKQTLDNVMPDWYDKTLFGTDDSSKVKVSYLDGETDGKHAMIDVNPDGYEVTVTINDTVNYCWADDKGKDSTTPTRKIKYVINKLKINVDVPPNTYPPVANIAATEIKAHDDVHGDGEHFGYDYIKSLLYFTYDSADGQKHYNKDLPTDPGDYTATINIGDCNYTIEKKTVDFKVPKKSASFQDSDLKWVFKNDGIENGKAQNMPENNHLEYNGYTYTISLADTYFNDLAAKGVMVEGGISGDIEKLNSNAHPSEGSVYVVKVKIVALGDEWEFTPREVTFNWYIDQAEYNLESLNSGVKWSYTARSLTQSISENGSVQYEGGTGAGALGKIVISITGGLPDTLKPVFKSTGYEESAVGKYTAKVNYFTNTDKNYIDSNGQVAVPDGLFTLNWEIVPRTLPTTNWTAAVYADGKVTTAPKLDTQQYNPILEYKYYETEGGPELTLSQLTYSEGVPKTYYIEVFVADSDKDNWVLGSEDNPHGFLVGELKTAVAITITAGGTYDGTPKLATVTLDGTYPDLDEDSFDIKYFKSDKTPIDDPTNAGSYIVEVTLKERFTADYYISTANTLSFNITTLELPIPTYEGKLTYNGEERNVAELVGLPDGWENYIIITITSKTYGISNPEGYTVKVAAEYTVKFTIKPDVNDVPIGSPNNVQWVGGTTNSKPLDLTVEKLILHADEWEEDGYDSYIFFRESSGRNFVEYTVTNANGEIVDRDTVKDSVGESFIVTMTIKDEHLGNVEIEYAKGVTDKYEFFTTGGTPPLQIDLPTIAELTFDGTSQTFAIDYGKFADYIEIDEALSDLITQSNAGEYTVYFKIKRGMNAVWKSTGGRESIPVPFKMNVLTLAEPEVKNGERFTYSGVAQSATLNIDAAILARFMKIEGDYTATNAGEYTFTLSIDPRFAGNVVWASNTSEVKTVNWTIEKAKISAKWKEGETPELDLPEEFKDLDIEYVYTDENGNTVSKSELEAGKEYTVTAKLKGGDTDNFEFVDDSGKPLKSPTTTDGVRFRYKNGESSFPWWIIAVIAGVLALLAAIIIIVVKRRNSEDEEEDFYDDEYDFDDEDIEEDYEEEDF